MTLPLKACLFDLDGVLVDTAKYHYLAWRRLAEELGFPFTQEDNERLKGVSRMASLDILLSIGGMTLAPDEKEALAAKKNGWYVEMISRMDESEILPGALDFLKACREAGLKVALGSASKNSSIILTNTGLTPYFDAIIDGTKTQAAKPDPEVFLLGAEALGVSPAECVVFEDAEAGIEAARRGGMRSVGIGSPTILNKADLVVPSLGAMTVGRLAELT
ncbi:beta-phosphoglucomutase [Gorillibacterium timonense]|uniref:beta-phosphoglucomutase n=1 Tax=Gorillibacterium timonense TaxID=1689269 RepID=UPI00071C34DA|nr:beta-phosphoglucomutase [Gorillibacterium timonense]